MTIFNQFRNKIFPYIAEIISSRKLRNCRRFCYESVRVLTGKPHRVEAYLKLSDPYSYVLSQLLPALKQYYAIEIDVFMVRELPADMFPEPDMWQQNGLQDARYLAQGLALDYPQSFECIANPQWQASFLALLLETCGTNTDLESCARVFREFWLESHNARSVHGAELTVEEIRQLESNQQRLMKKGHYQSAMLWFSGEWYWGADRLWHLETRLQSLGLGDNRQLKYQAFYQARDGQLPTVSTDSGASKGELILYLSIRSPYSYLALEQAIEFCQVHQLSLTLKPVLPMVMRGLPVPQAKKMYIFHDTKREAQRLGLSYGRVADPLGQAVKNCYALFEWAKETGQEQKLLQTFARAVNSEGVDGATQKGLELIVKRAGLDWEQAGSAMAGQHWQDWAESHRLELQEQGLWGVPCFSYRDTTVWGQDRLWVIAQAIQADIES